MTSQQQQRPSQFSTNDNTASLTVSNLQVSDEVSPTGRVSQLQQAMRRVFCRKIPYGSIINGVSLEVSPGQLCGIIGPPKCGATTVLNAIALSMETAVIAGSVMFGGKHRTHADVQTMTSYMLKNDRNLPNLTVTETLMFVAWLRLPGSTTRDQRARVVHSVLTELGLVSVAHARVGTITPSEQRRVSLGTHLLTGPSIMLLDEPTFGLSNHEALDVMMTLRELARSQRVVVCTVHEPRSNIFALFDVAMVMAQGSTVYSGPTSGMLAYFSKAGYACTESQCNPSEHVLGLVRVDSASAETEAQSRARITALTDAYRASHESSAASDTGVADAGAKVSAHKSRLAQFGILLDRFLRNILRSWHQLKWEFGPMILLSLLIGFVFYQLTTDQFGAHDRLGLVYVAVSFGAIRTILYTVERVENDRGQLYSELQDDLYGVMAFYWARFISRLPVDMLVTLVYAVPMYMISGLQEDATRFFSFLCFMFATLLLSRTLGEAISAWITDIQGALAAANVIFNVVFIPTGFFVHIYIPAWWLAWFAWISFLLRFPMEGILKFEYDGLTFTCPSGPCPITDETTAMEALYMQSANYWFAVGIILLLNVITIVLGLLGLYFVEQRPVEWGAVAKKKRK